MTKFLCSDCQIKVECTCNFFDEKCEDQCKLTCSKCSKELSFNYQEWTREQLIERIRYLIKKLDSLNTVEEKQEFPTKK